MSEYQKQRYYYCQLKKDFFKDHPLDVIRGMEGGREALLLYVELLLDSAGHNGRLLFEEGVPYTEELLSAKFSTPIDIIKKSLGILRMTRLVSDGENHEIVLLKFNEYIGSRTNGADIKSEDRRQREDTGKTKGRQTEDNGKTDGRQEADKEKTEEDKIFKSTEYRDKNIEIKEREKEREKNAHANFSDSSSDGGYMDTLHECTYVPQKKSPPTWEEVKRHITGVNCSMKIPETFAKAWYDDCVFAGWIDGNGKNIIPTWRSKLGFRWRDDEKEQRKRNPNGWTDAEVKYHEDKDWERQKLLQDIMEGKYGTEE